MNTMTDPIADMITRIKNAFMARHTRVSIPHSKLKESLAQILKDEGYIAEFAIEATKPQATLSLELKYIGKTPSITEVKRVSRPGRRLYSPANALPRALGGYGITIVSTSKGIMTDKSARKLNVGGEVLCQIW